MGSVKHLGESCTDESCLTGDSSKHEHQQLNPDSTTMPALIEKRYEGNNFNQNESTFLLITVYMGLFNLKIERAA